MTNPRLSITADDTPDPTDSRRLFRLVIAQAVLEALSVKASKERDEARHWIFNCERAFGTVCDYAGMNPDYIRHHTKRSIDNGLLCKNVPLSGRLRALAPTPATIPMAA